MDESQEQSRGALGSDCHRKQLRQQKKTFFYKSDGGRILEISKEVTGTLNCMKNQKDSLEERKRRAQLPLWGSYHTVRKKIKQRVPATDSPTTEVFYSLHKFSIQFGIWLVLTLIEPPPLLGPKLLQQPLC